MYSLLTNLPNFITSLSPIIIFILIIMESILPFIPVSVIMAYAMINYGFLIGYIMSYVATIIGCILAFSLSRYLLKILIIKKLSKNKTFNKIIERISVIHFASLALIMALPFTPAFLVNIGGGISKISLKKFILALLIGKSAMVYFWGFIGTSLFDSITDPYIIIKVVIMLLITYIISKIVSKRFGIE